MTEKRFTHRKWYNERQLFDGEEPFAIVDIYTQSDKICDKLNELADENEQLKEENQRLEKQKNVLIDYMDNWCPKRFYDGIIKRMEEVE